MIDTNDFFEYKCKEFDFHHTFDQTPNPSKFKIHNHAEYELYLFIRGKGEFYVEGNRYNLSNGDILIMIPSKTHYIDPTVPYKRCALHFTKKLIKKLTPTVSY